MKIPQLNLKRLHNKIKNEIDSAISGIFDKSAFIGGHEVEQFEHNFSLLSEASHCISCGNGTDALYIATKSLNIKPGDEVIVPAMSWLSTSEILNQSGAKPVFVDIDPVTYCIDSKKITEKITNNTVGIIPVHLYGHPADMVEIMKIANKFNLWVIEDCAQAHLAELHNKKVGTFGDFGTFSFFPGKNLGAIGDAGALITNKKSLSDFSRKYANHGQKTKHYHEFDGINSRMDGINAAVLNVKMNYIKKWNNSRQILAQKYEEGIDKMKVLLKPSVKPGFKHSWHLYSLLVEDPIFFQNKLQKKGISSSRNYPRPLSRLPQYNYKLWEDENALKLAKYVVNIPMCPMLSDNEIDYIIETINN